ncbi:hypothetical protein DPMN_110923 [Dreissena polymorpha]|uniref:Uncharacterized protein n=1 Tax=Dreissena polymorpha TaxID=45954 RepID=A0A9D4KDB0_DREPO|nr:hypothetical protein DPMN_110923 [Dreissena polymorpha]
MLLEAMRDCNLTAMQEAMKASVTWELPETDPDLVGAKMQEWYVLQLKSLLDFISELHIALLVHRIDVAEHALYRTRKANLEFLLALDTGGWMADIPSIDRQTLPRVEVKLVLNAMYMLLGLDESFLKCDRQTYRLTERQTHRAKTISPLR